jgi:hypothetical protein
MTLMSWLVLLGTLAAVALAIQMFGGLREGSPVRRALAQPPFVVAAIILLIAALSLNGATEFMRLHFKKLPVALRKEVDTIPSRIGPWMQVSKDQALNKEVVEVLGTEQYIFRDYMDTREVEPAILEQMQGAGEQQRKALIDQVRRTKPHAFVHFAVTYYTGMVDTVAHIPDRCYVGGGFQPASYEVVQWPAFDGRGDSAKARFIQFEDQSALRNKVAQNVAYLFHVNGRYESDPTGVRVALQDLRQRYGYYAKIELMTLAHDRSAKVMNDFLAHALPVVEECLPDWNKVIAGPVE